ncbi:MAG: hypothetical protein IIZ78_18145 [Clostridiales bacterium]|nr:hypothetical protein [Clostridiales bacterium]
MGCQDPSVRITPKYDNTDGMRAAKILKVGGLILDPWQMEIMDDWLAYTPGQKWINKTCGGSVPRQNGKTCLIAGRAEAGMVLYNEQVLYTAHLQKTATETFEEMAAFFDSPNLRKYVKDIKTALGREQIILTSGARVKFLARTRNGGRGQHGDLLIFDEAQELDSDAQASFLPAISASLNPQTIYVGTPPDPNADGTVFRSIRKKALEKGTKSTSWFEFSVDKIGDVTDKKRWVETNPALGRRIMLSTIEGECEQMDEDMFARERLGWWTPIVTERKDLAIPKSVWEACKSDDLKPEGKTAYGIKFSPDGSEVCLCGAVIPKDGPARISLIERKPTGLGTQWLADWLNARYKKASCVVIDGKNGVDVLIDKIADTWKYKDSVKKPSAKDVIAAVSLVMDSLNEKTITWYSEQEALKNSALTSIKRPIGGGWGFGGEDSAPIEACALALWGAKNTKRDPSKSMRIG